MLIGILMFAGLVAGIALMIFLPPQVEKMRCEKFLASHPQLQTLLDDFEKANNSYQEYCNIQGWPELYKKICSNRQTLPYATNSEREKLSAEIDEDVAKIDKIKENGRKIYHIDMYQDAVRRYAVTKLTPQELAFTQKYGII